MALAILRRAGLVVLVCCGLLIIGCGSSDSGSSSSKTARGGSATSTGPGEIQGHELDNLPKAPEPSRTPPKLASPSTGDQRAYLEEVFRDAQAMWQREFSEAGDQYADARLRLFSRAVHSTGCGAQADVGPFYCGVNHTVYLDLGFFRLLVDRFGIGGFAPAYINAHEVGHHVQNLIGLTQRVAAADRQDPSGANDRSVRVELQADCLAGVWAHSVYTRGQLTRDELNEALRAAEVLGDDFQTEAAGHAPDSSLWTHGSSEQRQRWLKTGFDSGEPGACDTFTADNL